MRSLTGSLFREVILVASVILLIAGIILYLSVSARLVHQMDESLSYKARMLALSVEEKHYGLEVDIEEMMTETMEGTPTQDFVLVASMDGRTIYRSPELEASLLPTSLESESGEQFRWHDLPDGKRLRTVILTFSPEADDEIEAPEPLAATPGIVVDTQSEPGDKVAIQLFRDATGYLDFMRLFLLLLLMTGIGSISILSMTVWWTIARGAEPVNRLASDIEALGDQDLALRLDENAGLRELAPIVNRTNLLLGKLEDSFTRERGFTSDAAHELRTPLAGLKSTIEVALSRERTTGEYRETLFCALDMVGQLEGLVKSLLVLARLDSGQETRDVSKVALEDCILDVWKTFNSAAEEKRLKININVQQNSGIRVHGVFFRQVLEELIGNALYYVDDEGELRIELNNKGDGTWDLNIANTGSRVSSDETVRVFDRFWRGRYYEGDTAARFGLGLPIVRKIVETLNIGIKIQSEQAGEFAVTLRFPGE